MKKSPLLLSLIFFLAYRLINYLTGEVWLSLLIFIPLIGLLILNLSLRKSLRYKKWFLNSVNLFIETKTYHLEVDLSADLLFDKLLEVIEDSEFKLLDSDKDSAEILCGTSANFLTWGENMYIQLWETNGTTSVQFISTTLFGKISWNRNEKNYESFIASFEASLTI